MRTRRTAAASLAAVLTLPVVAAAQPVTCGGRPEANCQPAVALAGTVSNRTSSLVADDFKPGASGAISAPCWTGWYSPQPVFAPRCDVAAVDSFRVRYHADAAGLPGPVLGEFLQADATLTVARAQTGRSFTAFDPTTGQLVTVFEWAFTATHAPLAVAAGQCYWLEITNDLGAGGCAWSRGQGTGGDGRMLVDPNFLNAQPDGYDYTDYLNADAAFCLDVPLAPPGSCLAPPPANDVCAAAVPVACGQTLTFDNVLATNEPGDPPTPCLSPFTPPERTVWFSFVPTGPEAVVSTCGSSGPDSIVSVYSGECGSLTPIDCNDDACGKVSRIALRGLTPGQTCYARVGGGLGNSAGTYTISVECSAPPQPQNTACPAAATLTPGVPVTASNADAAPAPTDAGCGYPPADGVPYRGVWYSVTGTGTMLTASTCSAATTFNTEILVICGSCAVPTCVGVGTDGPCDATSVGATTISWCSQLGAQYLLLVAGGHGDTGTFELTVTGASEPCQPDVRCLPEGACCTGQSCQLSTAPGCAALSGRYLGDATTCGEFSYAVSAGGAFEDIALTGAPADPDQNPTNIGFTFRHYGQEHTQLFVSFRGLLVFDGPRFFWDSYSIPSTQAPDNFIAPLYSPLDSTTPPASVVTQTLGDAPSRRFIVQYTDVQLFFGSSFPYTFQAVLFEGSDAVELRYRAIEPEPQQGQFAVGVENAGGTLGTAINATLLASGQSYRLTPRPPVNPCVCPADFNGQNGVDLLDIFAFLNHWFGGCTGPGTPSPSCTKSADFNHMNGVDLLDIFAFLNAWFGGC